MTYLVWDDASVYELHVTTPLFAVGTPAWYAWLEQTNTFTFQGQHGFASGFTLYPSNYHRAKTSDGRGDNEELNTGGKTQPTRIGAV